MLFRHMADGELRKDRAAQMRVLALAPWAALQSLTQPFADCPHDIIRGPEIGLLMLRGRMGGSGAPFNLGEATVARCTVKLANGTEGHAYVLGRNGEHAHRAALCDALLQSEEVAQVEWAIAKLAVLHDEKCKLHAAKAAATKFTSSHWCVAMFNQATMNNSRQSARAFRVILDAMARPGKISQLPLVIDDSEPAFATSMTALLSLGDHLTSIYLAVEFRRPEIERLLRFHTGSQLVQDRSLCDFAVLTATEAESGLELWKRGNPEYPDQSATIIIQTTSLTQGHAVEFSGPGIQSTATVRIANITPSFWKARAEVNAVTPLGIDMIFVSPREILGCPRSTHVVHVGGG